MALWTLLLCFPSLILLHGAATNWECTLSIPQRTTKTEQHASSHQQLSLTHPAATSSVYCENSGENMKLCTFTTKWLINERKVITNFRATKTPSVRRTGGKWCIYAFKSAFRCITAQKACRWYYSGLCGNVRNKAGHSFSVNMWGCSMCASANWYETSAIPKPTMTHRNKIKALIGSKYTCLFNSGQVTHTNITWAWMLPRTITNNCLHPLKDFPRRQCLPYQYCPLLPPLPAVLRYHIWPLCAQGDFQPLTRWAGWEWASDLWAAFL